MTVANSKNASDMNFIEKLLRRHQDHNQSQVIPQFEVVGEKGILHVDASSFIGDSDIISQIDSLTRIKQHQAKQSSGE